MRCSAKGEDIRAGKFVAFVYIGETSPTDTRFEVQPSHPSRFHQSLDAGDGSWGAAFEMVIDEEEGFNLP